MRGVLVSIFISPLLFILLLRIVWRFITNIGYLSDRVQWSGRSPPMKKVVAKWNCFVYSSHKTRTSHSHCRYQEINTTFYLLSGRYSKIKSCHKTSLFYGLMFSNKNLECEPIEGCIKFSISNRCAAGGVSYKGGNRKITYKRVKSG